MKAIKPKLNTLALALLPLSLAQAGGIGFTQRVDVSSKGVQAEFFSLGGYQSFISYDGRYVVFASDATTLVADDTNGLRDVFMHDQLTGRTERVSVATNGDQAEQTCWNYYSGSTDPTISANGRYVAFSSSATNLVAGDTNCMPDVFLRDLKAHKTYRISAATTGEGTNDWSGVSSLSADSRYVAFWSQASNLVAGDNNGFQDAFVHDRQTGKTRIVSISSSGVQGNSHAGTPTISADGRYVAFGSNASNLVSFDYNNTGDIFLRDLERNKTTLVSINPAGFVGNSLSFRNDVDWWNYRPAISADGRYVAFTSYSSDLAGGDINGQRDVFVRDTQANTMTRANADSYGQQAWGGDSARPAISADGRVVSFTSIASNLDPLNYNSHYQIFMRDRVTGQTTLASQSSDGALGSQDSYGSGISADGRYVVFESNADNLIFSDTNAQQDIFIRDELIDSLQLADVSLSQSTSANPVKGKNFSYIVTLKNAGSDAATNVSLVDIPPAQDNLVSVKPSRGSCNRAAIVVCRLGTLAKGDQATVVITVKAIKTGQFINQAAAHAAPVDPVRTNNASALMVRINP